MYADEGARVAAHEGSAISGGRHGGTQARPSAEQPALGAGILDQHNEQHGVTQILAESRGALTATGLNSCLTGLTARAVKIVVVPGEGLIPGFACEVCGTLANTPLGATGPRPSSHPPIAPA